MRLAIVCATFRIRWRVVLGVFRLDKIPPFAFLILSSFSKSQDSKPHLWESFILIKSGIGHGFYVILHYLMLEILLAFSDCQDDFIVIQATLMVGTPLIRDATKDYSSLASHFLFRSTVEAHRFLTDFHGNGAFKPLVSPSLDGQVLSHHVFACTLSTPH